MAADAAPAVANEMITIPAARLAELEAEITTLKERLAKRSHYNISNLREYDAAHPEKKRESTKKYKAAHREEINARRRELYRLKKVAAAGGGTPGHTDASTAQN
jgi:patatin-like phospholipase/acyl hydrolase